MPNTARLKTLSPVGRWLLVTAIFLATVCAAFFTGSYFTHSYAATALLIGPSSPVLTDTNASAETSTPESEPAPGMISNDALLTIDSQFYPGLVTSLAPDWAIAQTRSHFSVARIQDSAPGLEKLRVTFTNHSRETALRVTNALAAELARSSTPTEPLPHTDPVTTSTVASPTSLVVAASARRPAEAKTAEPQPAAESQPTAESQKGPVTLTALRYSLGQLAQHQANLEQQLLQQSTQLATIQRERQRPAAAAKDNPDPERERQLKKHDADEAALRSQLAAATQTMNDLGQRYTTDYPEYLNAKDRVEELQTSLNQFQSKPFVYVPEAAADSPRHLAEHPAELDQQETAIKATLQILQQELDRNQIETKRVQALVINWSRDNLASSPGSPARMPLPSATPPSAPDDLHPVPVSGYTVLEEAAIISSTTGVDLRILSIISLGMGLITASATALLTRSPHKIIKGEEDLENELPARIKYLGGIPRIKHEIISR